MTTMPTTRRASSRYREWRLANRLAAELAQSPSLRSEVSARMTAGGGDAATSRAMAIADRDAAHRAHNAAAVRTVSPFG